MSYDKNAISITMLHVSSLTDTSLSKYSSGHLFAKNTGYCIFIVSIIMIIGPDMRTFTGKTIFFTVSLNMFWVFRRTVSMRRIFWVPTTYVLVEK